MGKTKKKEGYLILLLTLCLFLLFYQIKAQAAQTFYSYCTNITCIDTGDPVQCSCSEVNNDDGDYAGPGANINCDLGYCIITIEYFNLMPQNSVIKDTQAVVNWKVSGLGPNALCKLEVYKNSTETWNIVTTNCPTTEATYYYNISSIIIDQSDFEKVVLRFNYTDNGQPGAQRIAVDQSYLTASYLHSTNLSIWDETDTVPKNPGDEIMFWVNYTNSSNGAPIDSANCTLYLNIPGGLSVLMNYNATSGLYYYNWTSDPSLPQGTYEWNVTCVKDFYEQKTKSDTFNLGTPYVITDSDNYLACSVVYYKILVYDVNDNLIDSQLDISIINPSNVTVEQISTTTGNGGIGTYLGSYILNATAQAGDWTIKVIAGVVKEIQQFIVS